jgi:hypothetical protein
MDLTRYWRARHNGCDIEAQWTGFRFRGGWTLRLLVDGDLKAEHKVGRWAQNFAIQDGAITVNFWGKLFRHRCSISAGGTVLTDRTQAWNALALAVVFSPLGLCLILALFIIVLHAAH